MRKIVKENYQEMCSDICQEIIMTIKTKPDALICIAGGTTPLGVMEQLVLELKSKQIDYSNVKFISLDEWVGISKETPGSCLETLDTNLFSKLHLKDEQVIFFDGKAKDLNNECLKMNKELAMFGPIDIIILGIGMNGHIGFNEPGVDVNLDAHIVDLDDTTKQVMGKYFKEQIQLEKGISLGFRQIKAARKIIVMANGEHKKTIVNKVLTSTPDVKIPATILKDVDNCTLIIDKQANGE